MRMLASWLTAGSAWWSLASAQAWRNYNNLCDRTIDGANASGVVQFNPNIHSVSSSPEASWAYTVVQNASSVQAAWWYSTGGANYSDDFGIGYDVCTFRITNLTRRAMADAHYHHDQGDCTQVLSKDCIRGLKDLVVDRAMELVGTTSPARSLTEGALPAICEQIATQLLRDLPTRCEEYFDPSHTVDFWQLTDYNHTSQDVGCCSNIQYESCPLYANESKAAMTIREITGSSNPHPTEASMNRSEAFESSWHDWWGIDIKYNPQNHSLGPARERFYVEKYDFWTQGVFPMLTLFMPVANPRRETYLTTTEAELTCLRATHFSPGSRNVPLRRRGLSPGAVGGIAAGSVIGTTILLVAAWLYWRHRRNATTMAKHPGSVASKATEPESDDEGGGGGGEAPDRDKPVAELDKCNEVFEKEGTHVGTEMDATAHKRLFELQGDDADRAAGATYATTASHAPTAVEMQGDHTLRSELESPSDASHTLVGTLPWRDVKDQSWLRTEEGGEDTRTQRQRRQHADADRSRRVPEQEIVFVAELAGSEPPTIVRSTAQVRRHHHQQQQQQNDDDPARHSWTPSIRLGENTGNNHPGENQEGFPEKI